MISGAQFAILRLVMSGLNLHTLLSLSSHCMSSVNDLPSGWHNLHTCQMVPCVPEIYTLIIEAQGLAVFLIIFLLCYRTAQGHGSSFQRSVIWLSSNIVVYS